LPVESGDDIHFSVELDDASGRGEFIRDAKLKNVSVTGLGFSSNEKISLGDTLTISIHFRRLRFDISSTVVRVISGHEQEHAMNYGVEIEDEDREKMSRFVGQLINYFSQERIRDCLRNIALSEKSADLNEGFEMFSLMLSLFKDITLFAHKEGFIESMLEEITRILNAQRAVVYLINTEENKLEAHASIGVEKELLKFDYRKGVAGAVFTTGSSLNVDVNNDKIKFFNKLDKKTGYKTKSVISSPVTNRQDKVIGVLEVINKRNQDRFTEEDERTMKVLSLIFSCFFSQFNPISKKSIIRRFSAPFARDIVYIGKSESTTNLRKTIVKLKDNFAPVLIRGERGVGKTLYANILHSEGNRGLNEFEIVNCKSLSDEDIEMVLFGDDETVGVFEKCKGGTVCFKEITYLPRHLQKKIIEIVNKNELPNGMKFDSRIICTSTEDVNKHHASGEMNEDFFQFVTQYLVDLDPIRERKNDIGELIDFYLARACKEQGYLQKVLSDEIKSAFIEYDWPGNVEELKVAIGRLVRYNPKNHVITDLDEDSLPILESPIRPRISKDIPYINDFTLDLKDRVLLVEREMIIAEIKRNKGNKSKASKEMGISREALRKKMIASDSVLEKIKVAEEKKLKEKKAEERRGDEKEAA
jgi:Nif-specific regulatory protein